MFLLVVTDKTAHERSLFRSDANVKWSARVATCDGGCVVCVCACVDARVRVYVGGWVTRV